MESQINDLTVIAVGGNSLLDPTLPPTIENQFAVTSRAMEPVVELLLRGERLILTHGNGPQVGFMQLRSELAKQEVHELPLDTLVATTQGSIGFMIQRALREQMINRGLNRDVISVVTEVEVQPDDPAFQHPTKPIGSFYTAEEALELERDQGWTMVNDANRGYRRVVPSPRPTRIVQLNMIRRLHEMGATVVCCGGGGIPIVRTDGKIFGTPAVIDKDLATMLLARDLRACRLVITTGVDAVYKGFTGPNPVKYDRLTNDELKALIASGEFPAGSMLPKMEAAARFLDEIDGSVTICKPTDLVAAMNGECGTLITRR